MAARMDPPAGIGEPHLLDYWRVVWQGRYTALSVIALVVGLAILRVSLTKPAYEAATIIEIRPEARRIIPGQDQGLGAEGGGWLAEERYFATQLEIIGSRDVAEKAFRQLHLDSNPDFAKASDPVAAFQSRIRVRPKVNTRLVNVSMTGEDPREVRDWVNAVADVYVKRNIDVATQSFKAITDEIQKGLDKFREDIGTADVERMQTAANQELFSPENQQEMLRQSLNTYGDGLSKVNVELASLEAEIDSVDRIRKANGDLLALPRFGQDPELQSLNSQKLVLQRDLERIGSEKKPGHPDYLAKAADLRTVQQRIDEQIATIEGKLRSQHAIAQSNASYLTSQIHEAEKAGYRVKQKSSEYESQKTDTEAKRKVYDVVAETVQRLSVGAQLIAMNNNIVVLDRAIAPLRPVSPRKLLTMGVGVALGLLAGIGLILFMEYLDNTIRSPEDVEHYLGVPMLGLVPKYKESDTTAVREAFQSLRTSILFASHNREHRILLLTSTGAQEGKSSTVATLARTMAGAGDRVVIVDCDLRRPTQHTHHGVEREPGITNYLLDGREGDYAPFLHDTSAPTLKLMTCGPIPPNPPDLIGLAKFRALLASLKRDFDWVLVDSPPVASLADSVVLASIADMMILVIKHNQNDRDLVRRSLKRLKDINANILGAVINNIDLDKVYHGDYYYSGYYPSDDGKPSRADGARRRGLAEGRRPKKPGKIAL